MKCLLYSPFFKTLATEGVEYNKNSLIFWCIPDYVGLMHVCSVCVCVAITT